MSSLSFSAVIDQSLPVFVTAESDAGFACEIKLSFKTGMFYFFFCFPLTPARRMSDISTVKI